MTYNNWVYIAVMAAVSYAIRVLPLTLIRKPIKNQFIQSFLYYVPYVTLAVMTFPAIVNATQSPAAGAMALVAGIAAVALTGAAVWSIYETGTGIYRVLNMPGVPMPSNRIELAELLWEHAGKPEPVSTALYSDCLLYTSPSPRDS